ncbi:aminotransferase class I/II-fold pyridoxal phosphate-dependent enzyme [bacterium]|nr:aminotransferase class I/II-fold pyridoxal phosphate-dependent enzyme [bacterium]
MLKLSRSVSVLQPSLTLALTAKAKAMKAEGIDVVSFGAGEPDFDTPDFIKAVAIEDIQKGVTKYTAERGGPDVLKAVCATLKRDYKLEYKPDQIVVSNGGKHSLWNIMFALINPGDEVIIPAPYWLTYPEQVNACGGVSVIVNCPPEAGFKITPAQLRAAITPKTKAFILNSPSNPTGAVYSKEELLALGAVLKENPHVALVSDDLYQKLVYAPAEFHSLPAMMPELLDRSIIVNGLSKAYSMTGWRLGWAAGPKDFMDACSNLQGHSTSNVVSFTQRAAAVALMDNEEFMKPWIATFDKRRKMLVDGLNSIPGVKCDPPPMGAFYVFPDVSATYGTKINGKELTNSLKFAEIFLEEARVALVPGKAFGEDRCIRMSYATSEKVIEEGLKRMAQYLK